jgi:D-alanyl-D-alanine carboxypeptidase
MQSGCVRIALLAGSLFAVFVSTAFAAPSLLIDVDSGQVLYEHQSTLNWYPASLTKLMTVYVALSAVRDGRITMDTPFVMSQRAASMEPSKMGFPPGAEVTLDNALKMLMVKSPNDVAVMIAEGISGSVESFADEMNATAVKLGLRESHFVNPNGLPDTRQVSSARDMAMIGRALLRDFPDEAGLFGIGALQLGDQIIPSHNGLLGRYPGADGMKTGFTCAAGFNVVASATQNGKRLIVVVLGSPTPKERSAMAIALFDRGFSQWGGGLGPVDALPSPGVGNASDMHAEICSGHGLTSALASEEEEIKAAEEPAAAAVRRNGNGGGWWGALTIAVAHDPQATAAMPEPHFAPVAVFLGPKPGWTGPVAAAKTGDPPQNTLLDAPKSVSAYAPVEVATDKQLSNAQSVLQHAVHGGGKLRFVITPRKALVRKTTTEAAAIAPSPQKTPPIPEKPSEVNQTPIRVR